MFGCSSKDSAVTQSPVPPPKKHQESFTLTDIDGRSTTLTLHQGHLQLQRVMQPVVILYLFSTRAELCRAMLPDLNDLQHTHRREIFILGIVVPEQLDTASLRRYMQQNHTTFFISNAPDNAALASTLSDMLQLGDHYPLPTTLLFDQGRLVRDYEGITPIEMIRNDLAPHRTSTPKRK